MKLFSLSLSLSQKMRDKANLHWGTLWEDIIETSKLWLPV
jgi:hypothetical protein